MAKFTASQLLSNPAGRNAALACVLCILTSLFLIYSVSVTRSLVITGQAWISVFSFFALFSAIVSLSTTTHATSKSYTFGMIRAPVLAVFSTTVLAQLSAVFLIKESVERLFESGHHHGSSAAANNYFYASAMASSLSLIAAAYAVTNQPFNYVLRSAQSSVIQEHAADISHALCHVVPGFSRLLLPRINSLSLLAVVSTLCCVLTHWFMTEFWWFDSVAALVLSFTVFATMMPLSTYTGRILLQTTPPHVHNQIDRCISESSTIEGVLELKNGHFWQLDFNSIAGTIDVRVRRDADEQIVLSRVTEKLSTVVNILSVQILKDITTTWSSNAQHNNSTPNNLVSLGSNLSTRGHSHSPSRSAAHGHSHDHSQHEDNGHHEDHHHGGHGHSHNGHGHSHH
ncbi:cation efflux family domain-containing protein [Ditylenchus destructor]|uniref:Cation efflux family domain-containing protein n=1 Tax=Ditylenchus destructor TaxID=166010 RepID=A0AAD4NAC0_9BILA|nr:cation efflux family domain-containing protein [Ditylenchus destructor]